MHITDVLCSGVLRIEYTVLYMNLAIHYVINLDCISDQGLKHSLIMKPQSIDDSYFDIVSLIRPFFFYLDEIEIKRVWFMRLALAGAQDLHYSRTRYRF